MAASLSWGLIKNHAFIDGNKRIGFAALNAFLASNGWEPIAPKDDALAMVLQAATGGIDEVRWTRWVESNAKPEIAG